VKACRAQKKAAHQVALVTNEKVTASICILRLAGCDTRNLLCRTSVLKTGLISFGEEE
jgi:hypothetical protein